MTNLIEKKYSLDTFGIKGKKLSFKGFEPCKHPLVPAPQEYVFKRDVLRDILNFIDYSCGDGMMITGPTGSGKTSAIEQVAARLHYPCISYTCGGSTEFQDLVGQWVIINGDTVWQDGCLTTALRNGYLLILNEVDLVNPSELANLNGVLEGAPLIIGMNGGEIVQPHPNFRLFCTSNSNGNGNNGFYSGVQRQNMAFMDRLIVINDDYPTPEVELDILEKFASEIPTEILKSMIVLANKVRTIFKGEGDDESDTQLTITFSTRTLIRWAIQTQRNKSAPSPLAYALERALLNRCSEKEEVEAINNIAVAIFGDDYNTSES